MQIGNRFALSLPVSDAWPLLSDLGRVAPLMPGVQVDSVDEEGLHARMRVKVGPVTVAYKMLVVTESLDETTHTAVLRGTGRETRGQGTVAATVTAKLDPADGGTVVTLTTDLEVTGRVAQFGGGVMKEVADRLLQQFADKLESDLAAPAPAEEPVAATATAAGATGAAGAPTTPASVAGAPTATPVAAPEVEPIDLGRVAGAALLPRAAGAAAVVAVLALLIALLRPRRR